MASPSVEGGEPLAALAVGLHGAIGPFDSSWCDYAERLAHYFITNDIVAGEKMRAILLTAVGPATYQLLKTLASPRKLDELRFAKLVDLVSKHCNPKPSPIVKRFKFNSHSQKDGESIAVYVVALRKIDEYCEYGDVSTTGPWHTCAQCHSMTYTAEQWPEASGWDLPTIWAVWLPHVWWTAQATPLFLQRICMSFL